MGQVLRGRRQCNEFHEGITAHSLNNHYGAISTDIHYQPTERKGEPGLLNLGSRSFLHVGQTSTDDLPAWFLRLAEMFNQSVAEGTTMVEDRSDYT